ncbi:hypothetical protein MBM09_09730 [Flaviramulus sp. BrNp1-15]|uniref:hypothetical protein n=1 Tax=Flaviramulus sp. BrNp1-15 TaxID=2916754 RepID=UPI001EE8607A|nr:hypothetical protein [Flaviramulus sp. BrNp1-15]ULC58197.1 hypothetical protein MBM09_09730 [Flaviramulus sp. BrNp1-15]
MNIKKISLIFLIFSITTFLYSQDTIQIKYDTISKKVSLKDLPKKLVHNNKYLLKLVDINTSHIKVNEELNAYEYVSDIPEILKPIFLGTPNSNIMNSFEIDTANYKTNLFLTAMHHYDKLESIRSTGSEYYDKTKFNPKPNDTIAIAMLKQKLKLKSNIELVNQLKNSEQFILSALTSYEHNFEKIPLTDSKLEILHGEYATLKNIKLLIDKGTYRKALGFLLKSLKAKDFINIKTFKGVKDLTSIDLQVINTFTNDTIFEDKLSFKIYNNWSFDFTSGFIYSDVSESKYYLSNRNAEFDNVIKEDIANFDVSIGALGHLSYKFSPSFMAGVGIGASLSPFDGKLRYLTGLSLLFGEQKFIGLNVGVAFSKIKTLSDVIMKDNAGYFQPVDQTEINTVERVETGLYIGLTYNFFNKKK